MIHHSQGPVVNGAVEWPPYALQEDELAHQDTLNLGRQNMGTYFIIFTRFWRIEEISSSTGRFCRSLRMAPLVDLKIRLLFFP